MLCFRKPLWGLVQSIPSAGGYPGHARGCITRILGRTSSPLRLPQGPRSGWRQEATRPRTRSSPRCRRQAHLHHGPLRHQHPRHHQGPQQRGHLFPRRQAVDEDHRPPHARQRGLHGNPRMGNHRQRQHTSRPRRRRLSRHRLTTGVQEGATAAQVQGPQSHPPAPNRKPLPPQRAPHLPVLRKGPLRSRGQGRTLHLLRLPLPPQARQRHLLHAATQRQALRAPHRRPDQAAHPHRVQHARLGEDGQRGDGLRHQGAAGARRGSRRRARRHPQAYGPPLGAGREDGPHHRGDPPAHPPSPREPGAAGAGGR